MEPNERACPACGTAHDAEDNYCRQCGMLLSIERLPVPGQPATSPALAPRRPVGLPAPVAKVAAAVAIGTALQVSAGLAGRYLLKQAGRQAVRSLAPSKPTPARAELASASQEPAEGLVAAVSETVLIRRMWIRRG